MAGFVSIDNPTYGVKLHVQQRYYNKYCDKISRGMSMERLLDNHRSFMTWVAGSGERHKLEIALTTFEEEREASRDKSDSDFIAGFLAERMFNDDLLNFRVNVALYAKCDPDVVLQELRRVYVERAFHVFWDSVEFHNPPH